MRRNLTFNRTDGLIFHLVVAVTAILVIATLGAIEAANAQNRDGTLVDSGKRFQYSVMTDGDVAVVGAEWHDGFKGAAYVLRREGMDWVLEQKLSPANLGPYDHFGGSASISGDYIVVGAAWYDTFRGAAYVFKRVDGEWIQQQKITASDAVPDGRFGRLVTIDGSVITIAAGSGRASATYRFDKSGERWIESGRLARPEPEAAAARYDESLPSGAEVSGVLSAAGIPAAGVDPPMIPASPPPPVDTVLATNGTLEDRVEIRWASVGLDAIVYKVFRNGVLLSIVASDDSLYTDTTGLLNTTYSYCVVVKNMADEESTPVCADGRRIIFPPTSVSATDGLFIDRVAISWVDISKIEEGYYVYRDGARIDSTGPNASWVDDTTGDPDSVYTYEVRAFAAGEQSAGASDNGWRGVVLPPVNVSASDGEYIDRVVITWQYQVPDTMGARIYRDSVLIGSAAANVTSYEDTNVVFGDIYGYCVAAVDTNGFESVWVCDDGGTGLTPPGNVSASDSTYDDRITITWDDLCLSEDGYEIARALAPDTVVLDTTRANAEVYHDLTADADVTYTYFVRAVTDAGGVSTAVSDDGFKMIVLAPENIQATDGEFEDHVDITWESRSKTAVLFKISRDGTFIKTLSVGNSTYSDYGGTAGQVYDYNVVAVTALEDENAGVPDQGSRELSTPSSVAASDEEYEDKIVVSWADNSQIENGYAITRRDTSGAEDDTTFVTGPNWSAYTDYDAVPGVTYSYSVAAFDSINGEVGHSAPAEDLGLRVLRAPSNVQAGDGEYEEQVEIIWQDNSNAEDGYRIYRDSVFIGETADNYTTFTDTSPDLGVTHVYSVAAYDSVLPSGMGESERASDTGYTTILAPVSFNASDVYEDRIELTWVDASNVETGFKIFRNLGGSTTVDSIGVVGPNVTFYTDFPLNQGLTYKYCVKSVMGSTLASEDVCDDGTFFLETGIANAELSVKLQQSPPAPGGRRGIAVAVSGDAAIVGAADEHNLPYVFYAGAAYIFERNSYGSWELKQKLWSPDPAGNQLFDNFGYSVAISGGVAVVGVPQDDEGAVDNGSVHVWERNETTGDWEHKIKLHPNGTQDGWLGNAVAVSGDILVIGALYDSGTGGAGEGGSAWIYRRDGDTGDWVLDNEITADDNATGDHFGQSVTVSDDVVVIGAEDHAGGGAAYVFRWDGQDWTQEQKLTAQDATAEDDFGQSVAISGDVAIVGAVSEDEKASDAGAVYVFEFDSGDGTWTQTQKLVASDGDEGDQLGWSATMRGGVAIIGANGDDSGAGSAYIFGMDPVTGDWSQTGKFTANDRASGDEFGRSVSFSGETALFGAPQKDAYAGAAYVLELPPSPDRVSASDGAFDSRVRVSWDDVSSNEDGFRIYRDGGHITDVGENVEVYEDFDAQPGRTHEYSVAAFRSDVSVELERVSDFGWRPPNGNITGRISAVGGGASEGIFVGLDPLPTKALLLDGAGGYVSVPNAGGAFDFGAEDSYTVEAWFKYHGEGGSGSGGGTIVAKAAPRGSGPRRFPFWLGNMRSSGEPGRLRFVMSDSMTTVGVSSRSTGLNDNAWHHVSCVHDAAQNSISIYIDGDLEGITPYVSLGDVTNGDSLSLGAGVKTGSWYGGQIDEVRIWDVARSEVDIQATMSLQPTGDETGLVCYWPLDEGSSGVITDPFAADHYGGFAGGVYWSSDSAPLDIFATTGESGNYVLSDLHYGNETTFKVRPFEGNRQFEPPFTMITLSVDHPVENQVNFSDISSYTISGVVKYDGTDCPSSEVRIFVDGLMKGTTDKNGKFALSVDNGTYWVKPVLEGHSFEPDSIEVVVEDDIDLPPFSDLATRTLSGTVGGGCGRKIGDVAITVRSENNCLTRSVTADSAYSLSLPPQKYLVSASVIESTIPDGLIKSDVIRYFQNLGERQADLDTIDVIMDMTYRAPLVVSIEGLEEYIPTECDRLQFEGRDLPEYLPVIPQLTVLSLIIHVNEDYGSAGLCPLDTGTVVIYDEIFDKERAPQELIVSDGIARYTSFACTPSLIAGRVDAQGNDRSFQKAIRALAEAEGRTSATREEWVLVTGHVAEEGADFVTASSNDPIFILRDPPGDCSYSFVEEAFSCRANRNYEKTVLMGQTGVHVTLEVGASGEWFMGLGAGVIGEANFTSRFEHEVMIGGMVYGEGGEDLTVTFKRRLSTSPDQMFIGADADVFVGAGLNYIFAKTGIVEVTGCEVFRSTGVGFEPDSIVTLYAYTQRYIEDELIPELQSMVDYYDAKEYPDSVDMFQGMVLGWQGIVAMNDSLKTEADILIDGNRSFSGGTEYSFLCDSVSTRFSTLFRTYQLDSKIDVLGIRADAEPGGLSSNYLLKVPVTLHVERVMDYKDTTTTDTQSLGYMLSDHNPGDRFTVDVKGDGMYPTPVFDVLAGASSCPYEAWPDLETGEARVMARDKVKLFINPAECRDVPPDEPAVFKLELANLSPTGEPRRYCLREIATANPYGALIRANGVFINDELVYYLDPGQALEITITVERGAMRYSYENLGLMVYPLCEWWVFEDGGPLNLADSVFFDVTFEAPCSDITLLTPESGWVINEPDTFVTCVFADYELEIGDKVLTSVGMVYRRLSSGGAGPSEWTTGFSIISPDSGGTDYDWTPPDSLPDGVYELRAYTNCNTGGRVYSSVTTGTIDRHGPVVFGTPEPADEELSFGEDISITFNEPINCASIDAGSVTLKWLDGPNAGAQVGLETVCNGNTIVIIPTIDADLLEGRRLEASVSGISDGVGNEMESAVTWAFNYRKSRFAWSNSSPSEEVPFRNPGAVTAELVNGTGTPIDFSIKQMPAWIEWATPETGTLSSGASEVIAFSLPDTLAIGTYADSIFVEGVSGVDSLLAGMYLTLDVSCFPPQWEVKPSDYEHSMTMVAELDIGGAISTDTNDRVAAFVGNQLRGVTNVQSVSGLPSTHLAFLTIYGNRTQGETVRFQVWDDDDCRLYNATEESHPFVANGQIGSPLAPVTLTATDAPVVGDSVLIIDVGEGWTWFSTNILSPDMSVEGVTADLTPASGDVVKSQSAFSQFVDDATGWVPAFVLDNVSGYMIRLSEPGAIFHSGTVVDVDSTIPVSQGWNWMGYLPEGPVEVNEALDDLYLQGIPTTDDVIKSQEAFAQFAGGVWYGSLDSMRTGKGYKLSLAAAGDHEFNYPEYVPPPPSPPALAAAKAGDLEPVEGAPAWSVNPRAYQYNMTVTSVLHVGGAESSDPHDMIGAFVGDECRGVASSVYVDGIRRYVVFLMIHSNAAEGEEVTFRAFDADVDLVYDVRESLDCSADAVEGTVLEPLVFNTGSVREEEGQGLPAAFRLAQNFPNPFNPTTIIRYDVPAGGGMVTLRIYDVGGHLVRTLVDGVETAGRKSVAWHGRDGHGNRVATGVYFYRMTAPGFEKTRKMVLLK